MNKKGNDVSNFSQELSELRDLILSDAKGDANKYHVLDICRVKEDNRFLSRFLLAKKGNVKDAFKMIKNALEWRKNFDVHGITKDSIPSAYFSARALFPFNRDRNGNAVLLLRVKEYKKPPGEEHYVKKFIIYWLETMEKEYESEQITVVFNCQGGGISNIDMDMVRFMVTAFTNYYPRFLKYILVFEMPWLYNTAWRVIKSWLPESAVDRIKLVNHETVLEYIDKSQLHVEMGGTETVSAPLCKEPQEPSEVPNKCTDEFLIQVNPSRELKFLHPGFSQGVNSDTTFSISNVSKYAVVYKIKTTSRERYRAWPFAGLIKPGDRVNINAQLINNATCRESDKFLILVAKVGRDILNNEINYNFISNSEAVEEYKLKCVMSMPPPTDIQNGKVNKIEYSELKDLQTRLLHIENNLMVMQQRQVLWLSFGCVLLTLHILLDYREFVSSFFNWSIF